MSRWIEKWKVPSTSGKTFYTVSKDEQDRWGCSCPAGKFRRTQDGNCKHVRAVQVMLGGSISKTLGPKDKIYNNEQEPEGRSIKINKKG
jgi:hypothetical protein